MRWLTAIHTSRDRLKIIKNFNEVSQCKFDFHPLPLPEHIYGPSSDKSRSYMSHCCIEKESIVHSASNSRYNNHTTSHKRYTSGHHHTHDTFDKVKNEISVSNIR